MSLRGLGLVTVVAGLLLLVGGGLRADKDEAEIRPSQIKKGSDFAPVEQRVSVRNHADYRRPEGILAEARHTPVRVDADSLHRRRLRMYAGTTYAESMGGQPVSATPTLPPAVGEEAAPEAAPAWGRAVAIALPVVVFGSFLIWWRRQMKHAAGPKAQLLDLRKRRHQRVQAKRVGSHITLTPHRR